MRATVSRRRLLGYGLGLAGAASLPTRPGRAADPHVVVIGAGLAGIAGARALLRAGIKVTVLEARNRIGGRAFTDPAGLGTPYDQGCFWLHAADRNPVADLIDTLGFELVPDPQDPTVYLDGRALADSDPLEESLDRTAFALDRAAETRGDVAAASVLAPRAPLDRLAADLVGPLGFGVELGELSVTDVTSSTVSDVEMVVRGGLGSAIAFYGGELPVLKSTPVRRIGWGGSGVRVGTAAGTIAADAVLITVPPGVLAAGAIRFDPALPADKQAAIANLPMGWIEKIALAFDRDVTDMVSFGTLHAELRDGTPLHALVRPFGQELVICSVGGDQARALGAAGMETGIDFALSGLTELFGNDVRPAFRTGHMTGWGSDPFAQGAVPAARPGHAAARAVLAAPLADRLFFAGDACVPQWAGQIAGALLSGQRAAADILAVL